MQSPLAFGSAPRRVPLSLQIANFFNGFSQIGWLIFGFGMIFAYLFTFQGDYSFVTFRGPHETVDGRVTRVEETGASENDVRVRANHYEYSVAGTKLTGTSYSTGSEVAEGETVTVEYDEDDPLRSRIEGMRRAIFGPFVLIALIFPAIGLGLMIPATLTGLKRNRLLRDGLPAQGKLIAKSATNMTVNKQRVYELTYEFTARDGKRCKASTRTSLTQRLEDDAMEELLYDPADPSRACLLDELPARPQFENGELRGSTGRAIRTLIFPAIIVGVHAFILWKKFG